MLQAALLDCRPTDFDRSPFSQNVLVASDVDVRRCDVVQAFVVAVVVVVIDKDTNLLLQVTRHVVVFQENASLHGLVPAFDLALPLRMERSATIVLHLLLLHPFSQFTRDVT